VTGEALQETEEIVTSGSTQTGGSSTKVWPFVFHGHFDLMAIVFWTFLEGQKDSPFLQSQQIQNL
jgi:hypothetical protein